MNSFQFTLCNLGRKPLATIDIVFPVGTRDVSPAATEGRFRRLLGGRLAKTPAPRSPLRLVVLATGSVGDINEAEADLVFAPVSGNGAARVVVGPIDGARQNQLERRYRLDGGRITVAESGGHLFADAVECLVAGFAAA